MGIGVSIFLIAVGAILTFATDVSVSGLSLDVVGVILMLVGALGLVMTLLVWGPRRRVAPAAEVVEERPVAPREVVEERPVAPREVVEERPVAPREVVEERPVAPREVVEERRVAPRREVVEERRTYDDPTL